MRNYLTGNKKKDTVFYLSATALWAVAFGICIIRNNMALLATCSAFLTFNATKTFLCLKSNV